MVGRALSRLLPLCSRSCSCVEQAAHAQLDGIAGSIHRLERGVASTAKADRQACLAGNVVLSLTNQLEHVPVSSSALVGFGQAAATTATVAARQLQALHWQSQRGFCEGVVRIVHAEVSENEYHRLADELLDHLQEKMEVFVEDMDIDGADVEHAQGVLTVQLGRHGTYVINKQTPNRQIWMSSPVSGPFRYDFQHGKWVYARTGQELLQQVQHELQGLLGSAPQLVE